MTTIVEAVFADRVAQAIRQLSTAQVATLRQRFPDSSGNHALVAAACGMKNQSLLSDILARRMPGTKYKGRLADVLGVDLAWLEGTGGEEPDWALPAITAWRRFAERLGRLNVPFDDEISAHPEEHHRQHAQATLLASRYGLDSRTPVSKALAAARYAEVPFDVVLQHARQSGLAEPTHPEHLRAGHAMWAVVQSEVEKEIHRAKRRFHRYLPPPSLFAVIRQTLLEQRRARTDTSPGINDALEMLWRQQWLAEDRPRSLRPEALQDDTGRTHWTRLGELRARWESRPPTA